MPTTKVFPDNFLRILPYIERQADEWLANNDDQADNKVAYFMEWHFENISEGSGQISPDEDRSARAFINLVKVDPTEDKAAWVEIGGRWERDVYRDGGYALIVTSALSETEKYAEALKLLKGSAGPKGPFNPRTRVLPLLPVVKAQAAALLAAKNLDVPEEQQVMHFLRVQAATFAGTTLSAKTRSMVEFAGLLRLSEDDLTTIVTWLSAFGLSGESLQVAVADIVFAALRADSNRLATGLSWSQPPAVKSDSTEG